MISIQNIPNSLRYELSHLPGNIHAHPPITTPTQQNEPPATKRTRLSTTPLWLHETNRPPNVTLNPPTSPTARPATPTFDDYTPPRPMATFDSRQLPLPLNPGLSHASVCTPTHHISYHHEHRTWCLLYYLSHLPSNTQGQTRRLLPHVRLKAPYAPTPHPLNHLKLMTPRRKRRRNQDIRLPTVNTP
jgi:hypothetical protein